MTGGTLVFHSDAGIYSAGIGADGTYAIAGMPAGEMVVTVDTEGLNPKNAASPEYKGQTSGGPTGMYGGAGQGGSPAGAKNKAEASPIPEGASQGSQGGYIKIPGQYADKAKSPLKVTVDTGKQEINLELKD